MMYQAVGENWAVFASKAGAPTNPDWYHNVVANPDATIEVGTETRPVRARVATGDATNGGLHGRRDVTAREALSHPDRDRSGSVRAWSASIWDWRCVKPERRRNRSPTS